MDLTVGTLGIYLAINVVGLAWTLIILTWGLPDGVRIQDRPHTWSTFRQRLPLWLFNVTTLLVLTYTAMERLDDAFDMGEVGWVPVLLGLVIVLLVDDLIFYVWHRLLHDNKWLYNKIHRIHHKAFSPLPHEYLYVHPLEWLVGAVGPVLGLGLVYLIWGSVPVWAFWSYILVRNIHELDIHSGIRSLVGHHIPLFGLTEHHDLHHSKPTMGNFSSTLLIWDVVFGTMWRPEARPD